MFQKVVAATRCFHTWGWRIQVLDVNSGLHYSLGNPSKDCQRFLDAIVLISAFEASGFEHRMMLRFAKLIKTSTAERDLF